MAASIPQGIMQGVQSAMQQVGQVSGMSGTGVEDAESKESEQRGEGIEEKPEESPPARQSEPAAEAGAGDGASAGNTGGERVPQPDQPAPPSETPVAPPAQTRPAESSPESAPYPGRQTTRCARWVPAWRWTSECPTTAGRSPTTAARLAGPLSGSPAPQPPWGPQQPCPPPPRRGNVWKWVLGAVALVAVIGVTVAVTYRWPDVTPATTHLPPGHPPPVTAQAPRSPAPTTRPCHDHHRRPDLCVAEPSGIRSGPKAQRLGYT